MASILLPLFLLGTVELGLRVAGYGYPTSFFVKTLINGKEMLVDNAKFGLRFFPPALARSPSPTVMAAAKPAGTYRIFVFGESAALGDPRPGYGVGRYLEVLLGERFPGTRFEVVCVAMTAINSHALLPMARECARLDGDLWVIYMGNNEMVGPFGASSIFGARAPSLRFVRMNLALKATRTGQLVMALYERAMGGGEAPNWGGMKLFLEQQLRPGDPRKKLVYNSFRENLDDILRAGSRSGVPIILSTVASNLRDCPPFASLHTPGLTASDTAGLEELAKLAATLESTGSDEAAAKIYKEMTVNDGQFAETRYRQALSFLKLGNQTEARRSFELARDLDALPFRTDTPLNTLIRQAASRWAGQGVRLVDAEEALSQHASDGMPGRDSFYEHVHLTFEGNYLLARSFGDRAKDLLPKAISDRGTPDWPPQEVCDTLLGLTDWNRQTAYEDMLLRIAEPPFTGQLGHPAHVKALADKVSEIKTRTRAAEGSEARAVYERTLKARPEDFRLHENFAEFLERSGRVEDATAEWQRVRELVPHHQLAYFHIGQLLARQKKYTEAADYFVKALKIRPDLADAYSELGQVFQGQGKPKEALEQYALARRLRPEDPKLLVRVADVQASQNQRGEALKTLVEAARLRPTYWEARYLLGVELASADRIKEAQVEFEAVTRLRPDYANGHLNLGVALAKIGRINDARTQFMETLRLDPQNQKATQYLNALDQTPK